MEVAKLPKREEIKEIGAGDIAAHLGGDAALGAIDDDGENCLVRQ